MSQQIPSRFAGGAVDLSHLAAKGAGPQSPASQSPGPQSAGHGQVVDVPAVVFELGDQSFEQAAQLSNVVPVVVYLRANGNTACDQLDPILEEAVRAASGRLVMGCIDIAANPGLVQAFQVQAVPAVLALVAGRPVPLFQGSATEEQIQDLFSQLLQLAEQQGLTGRVNAPDLDPSAVADPTPKINPAHAEALEALERGDYAAAAQAYEQVLLKAPADHEAHAALMQVRLLERLQGLSAAEIRDAAGQAPQDVDAQMRVADLDLSGGHIEDAFLRLLDLFAASDDADARTRIRERLLELFEVVGQADPRVALARTRLANMLY